MSLGLCILSGGVTQALAVSAFTLSWTHTVERTQWIEHWQVQPAGLSVVEARVKGSGAGMEPPDGARLVDGYWVYSPQLPPQRRVVLANSGAGDSVWRLCAQGRCQTLGGSGSSAGADSGPGSPIELSVC